MLGKGVSQLPRVLDIMGFDKLRPGQDRGIMSIMGGQDTICVFPTSMGKSAVYLIPALCHNWRLLVVSPLKALMRDQVKSLQEKGIGALSISSDQRDGENQQCVADWVRGDCKILYIAPERLKRDDFIRALRQAPPDMIAVDEAHVLSGWADNFRHAYMFIGEVVEMFQPRVVAAFSATMPKEIEADVRRVLRMPNAVKIFHFPKRENLKLSSGDLDLRNDMFERVRDTEGAVLVYCGTKDLTNKTSASLARFLGKEVGCYHSEVNESTKKMYQDSFKDDRIRVMCATNAFGMGVDKGNIRAVFHFRHPGDPEALSQEMGRAGRDGLPSVCHTYASKEAVKLNEGFIEKGYPPRDYYEKVFKALTKNCRNDGTFTMTSEALEKQSGVWKQYHSAIMEALHGHRVIENLPDVTKTHRVRFKNTSEEGAPFRFLQLKEVLPDIATEEHLKDGCWFSFDADYLSSKMDLTPATVIKHIKAWDASDLLTYDPPPPGKVKRIIGDLDLIDFKRLNVKKNKALARLDYVKGYFNVPDHEKHDYLNDYFLNL